MRTVVAALLLSSLVLPCFFLIQMALGAIFMQCFLGGGFENAFSFMASAITGGAIALPATSPSSFPCRLVATVAGSVGVGMFGFVISVLGEAATPLINAVEAKVGKTMLKPLIVCGIVVATQCVCALSFGGLLAVMEGMSYCDAMKTMISVQLGGGVSFYGAFDTPDSMRSKVFLSVIGVWGLTWQSVLIGLFDDTGSKIVRMGPDEKLGLRYAVAKYAIMIFLILPIVLFLLMGLLGIVMGLFTDWDFKGSFWAGLPGVTGGAAVVDSSSKPALTDSGIFILTCTATLGFFVLAFFISIGSNLSVPMMEAIGLGQPRSVFQVALVLVLASCIGIPLLVMIFGLLLGWPLSLLEGWDFMDGCWLCVAVQLGGGMNLTTATTKTPGGRCLGTLCTAWSIGIATLSVGLSGAPALEPLMVRVRCSEPEHSSLASDSDTQ